MTPYQYRLKEGFVPGEDEPICLISYVIASTRVGGGPDGRTGFWPAYREQQEINKRTNFRNPRIQICRPVLEALQRQNPELVTKTIYFRKGVLSEERLANQIDRYLGRS